MVAPCASSGSRNAHGVVVDERQRRARALGGPLEERLRLVVDLAHHDAVRALRDHDVCDQRERLHAAVGDHHGACAFELAEHADQCGAAGRAVPRIEMRELAPRAAAGDQERGLGFLPRDYIG
jgi:hypothetical protein